MEPRKARLALTQEVAETLAIQALGFIAEEPQSLSRFLDTNGIPVAQLRNAAREPGFLAGVLEHMLGDENLLLAFARAAGIDPAEVARAASTLGGHWERDVP